MNLILLSLIATSIFGMIDASFFLIGETTIQAKLDKISFLDSDTAELLTGGISSMVSIFAFSIIQNYINNNYKIKHNAFLDSIGVIIGTITIICIYKIYKKIKKIKNYNH
jgi:hypothetical protein